MLERGRGFVFAVLFVQEGFWWDRGWEGAEVESPNIPTNYLRGMGEDPVGQRRQTHLELWGKFPQLYQRLDLMS